MTHLERIGRLPIPTSCSDMIVDKTWAYVAANNFVHAIDLRDPKKPKRASTVAFKNHVGGMALAGKMLFVGESERALNFVRVANPKKPDYFDCVLSFGTSFYAMTTVGDRVACAINWDGVGLVDVKKPKTARWLAREKLPDSFAEDVVVAEKRLFVAGANDGLRVYAIEKDALVAKASPLPRGSSAARVFLVGDRVWVAGESKGKPTLFVVHPKTLRVVGAIRVQRAPRVLVDVGGGDAMGFESYTCFRYSPKTKKARRLFLQYDMKGGGYHEEPGEHADVRDGTIVSDAVAAAWMKKTLVVCRADSIDVYRTVSPEVTRRP